MTLILNHLWQSTLFALAAGLLTLPLRRNSARTRYWLWFAASVKFLVPFSLLVDAGSLVEWRTAPAIAQPAISVPLEQVFTAPALVLAPQAVSHESNYWLIFLAAAWLSGFLMVLFSWWRQWRRIRIVVECAKPFSLELPIKTMSSPTLLEPGVFGIFRPVLLLPEGIADRLMPDHLEAIVAHELCHVRSYDNLAAAVHMLTEAIFWFHPLLWWIGKRLVDERERACDEEVLRLGSQPQVYAESILKVCKLYLESPLDCVSGITGSDLRKRIRNIMTDRSSLRLNAGKKLLLAVAGIAAVIGPVGIGVLNAPFGRAQSQAGKPEFEVASVKLFKPGSQPENNKITASHGNLTMHQQTLRDCIAWAYNLNAAGQIAGPAWIDSEKYEIAAKADESATQDRLRLMLQALLAERFKLTIRRTVEQRPLYSLVVSKGGPKLREVQQEPVRGFHVDQDGTVLIYHMVTNIARLAELLPTFLDHPLLDKTGLTGVYDFTLKVEMDRQIEFPQVGQVFHGFGMTPGIFGAVEALGLKLASEKGPVDVLVVDHVERPSANDQAFFRKAMWTPQAFEVASIKPASPDATERGITQRPGGRLSTSNATLKQLVYLAYRVMPFQVSGGPEWVGSDGFNIEAKPAEAKANMEQFRQMIKTLLADRFQLKFHMETRQLPVYELVVGKRGAKLTEDKSENPEVGMMNLRGELRGAKATMPMLASSLSRVLHRQVLDETGLKGAYTLKLQYSGLDEEGAHANSDGASIFTALQEQLGLNLKATKGPVEVLVIDSAEKPSGN